MLPNSLGGSMRVSRIRVDRQDATFAFDSEDDSIGWVTLQTPISPAQTVVLEIGFAVEIPTWEQKVDPRFSYASGILKAAYSFPVVAPLGADGWDVRRAHGQAELSTREHAFFVVEFDTVSDFSIVSSGTQIRNQTVSGRSSRTVVAGPTNDFFWGGSYRFKDRTDEIDGVTLTCFAPADRAEQAEEILQYGRAALEIFGNRIAPYPFRELDFVISDLGGPFGGFAGAEFSGGILLGWREDIASHDVELEMTVVHEVAHQWFAAIVASDPIEEPWLDESLAQLATWLYFIEQYGPFGFGGFEQMLEEWAGALIEHPTALNMAAEELDPSMYGPLVYAVGPLVLWNALEAAIDQPTSVFKRFEVVNTAWRFLAAYVEQHAWRDITTAEFLAFLTEKLGDDSRDVLAEWLVFEE
jgi:hypothetical protein